MSVELSSRATASYETLPAIGVDEFVARLRGEEGRAQEGAPRPTAERSGGTTRPTEGAASGTSSRTEPFGDRLGREQAREDVEEIKEEIRSEEEERRRTGESPSGTERTQEATSQGRERGDQLERERDEDRGLVDRAKDAVMGSEEKPRRREDNERSDRR